MVNKRRSLDRPPYSALQRRVLKALTRSDGAGYPRLRWHSHMTAATDAKAGRGELIHTHDMRGQLIAGYTVRALVNQGLVELCDGEVARPCVSGRAVYRDYVLSDLGAKLAALIPTQETADAPH